MVGPAKLPKAKAEVKRPDTRLCTLVRQNMMEWKRTKDQSRLSRIVKVGSLDLEMIKSWIVTSRLSVRPIPGAACVVQCHPQFNISTNALQWFKEKLTPSIVVGIIVTIIIMIVIIIAVLVMRIIMNLLSSGKACNEER